MSSVTVTVLFDSAGLRSSTVVHQTFKRTIGICAFNETAPSMTRLVIFFRIKWGTMIFIQENISSLTSTTPLHPCHTTHAAGAYRKLCNKTRLTRSKWWSLQVGAGPSGLVLALSLRKNGIPVRIIDKEPLPRLGERGAGIHVGTHIVSYRRSSSQFFPAALAWASSYTWNHFWCPQQWQTFP